MKLFLVRHGQTDWNVLKKKQGRTDVPLNETGREQARELRDKIKDLEFDVCIASPLSRAYETAKIITGGEREILTDERLVERCFGEFEGMKNEDFDRLNSGVDVWDRKKNFSERGMESAREILARAKGVVEDLKQKYPEDCRILVVAHGSFLKAMYFELVGYDDETDFYSVSFKNAEMKEVEV